MRLSRKPKSILAGAVGITAAVVSARAGMAAYCGDAHCRAATRNYNLSADGAYAQFAVEDYTAPDYQAGGFTLQALWIGNNGGDWCEVGWVKGWQESGEYTHYHAQSQNGYYTEYKSNYAVGSSGTNHTYQIFRVAGQNYANIYIDLSFQAYCPIPVPSNYAQAGLEYTDDGAKAAVVNPHSLQWREYSTGTWRSWGYNAKPVTTVVAGAASRYSYPSYPTSFDDWTTN